MVNPKLRFKRPDGTAYPDWEKTTVGTLFTPVSEKNRADAVDNVITNSAEYGLIPQRDFFDKDIAVEGKTSNYTIIHKGDFVYNPRKSTTAPFGPFNCYELEEPGIVSPLYTCLKPKDGSLSDYLLWYFQTYKWHPYIKQNGAQGGARHDRVGMTSELMAGIPVTMPGSPDERERVVTCLESVNDRIVAQEQYVAALETQKKELLRQVFAREIRFKDENGQAYPEWEEMTVGQLFYRKNARNRNGNNTNVITNSAEFGLIPQRDYFDKDIAVDGKTENYYVIEKGDFVYNPRKSVTAPFGPFNCYLLEDAGIVSPLYTCLTPLNHRYSAYLLWYFQSPYWYDYIRLNGAQGGARHDRVGMTNELMDGIPVLLPSLPEQQRIADFFTALDAQIENERALLADWRQLKKGLLQQMFI